MEADVMSGAMSPEVQIKCAVEEGMENIFLAIFGENLPLTTKYVLSDAGEEGTSLASAKTVVVQSFGCAFVISAQFLVRHPDAENCLYRIADERFVVLANDWGKVFTHEAWCECNPTNGAKVIVRQVFKQNGCERWLVADSMEGEVLYRGKFDSLFPWAKEVVAKKWAHLPHVCLDTECRAMLVLVIGKMAPPDTHLS